ncbi:hypothetical protein BABINDRAFT_158945 [Babjeviella inositovora NRRL Y-12698]|uniref:Major facilitator superfamily (MFS) profile domain-containing protein n=1 Tax=Babjeviella inositovora NRRL Y-12698 TaxID=984486 RepID=A0A1E3QXE7_9ASCO|nr:uncharacterized protein BABINDRAFT_158945 [Babjeviella inositovora NRRL Y-12698]ODQ82326.1 hypothetical protein BABINDRAFT_158945 [Babjeviella inositovora NRRL Y-12698]
MGTEHRDAVANTLHGSDLSTNPDETLNTKPHTGTTTPVHLDDRTSVNAFNPHETQTYPDSSPLERTMSEDLARAILCEARVSRNSISVRDTTSDEGVDAQTLKWDSPDDPQDPMNWPSWKKWLSTMTVAFICLCVTFGSSLYVGGIYDIEAKMKVSQELGLTGLTLYLVGLAFGPAIAAPLSEIFGRKIVYSVSLPVSMLFIVGIALSKNIESILILRFFTGFFASPAMAIAAGSISDVFPPEKMGTAMCFFCLAPFCGPVLGPVVGNFVGEHKSWNWTMWVNLMAFGILLPFVIILPETYRPILLKKRALKRGITLKKPEMSNAQFLKFMFKITMVRPLLMLFTDPIILSLSVYLSFVFAVLFGFFEAFPIIFRGVYRMELGVSGLPFLGVGIGILFGAVVFLCYDRYVFFPHNADGTVGRRDANGNIDFGTPEDKLIICKIGAISLPISLFWLAWTSRKSVHWMVPLAAGVPFGFGLIMIFFSVIVYLSMCFPPLSVASAMAANNFLRYLLASVFPLFTIQMYTNLGIGWATSTFGFISLAMVPVPWVLTKYGLSLRNSSKFGYAAAAREAALKAEAGKDISPTDSSETVREEQSQHGNDEHKSLHPSQDVYYQV